jgi:hypothetical protein
VLGTLDELGVLWRLRTEIKERNWDEWIALMKQLENREGHCGLSCDHEEGEAKLGKLLPCQFAVSQKGSNNYMHLELCCG